MAVPADDGFIPDDDGFVPDPAPVKQSRFDRVVSAIKSAPGHAVRLGAKGLLYQQRAEADPVWAAKDLTDFSVGGTGDAAVRGYGKGASAGFIDELDGAVGAVADVGRTVLNPQSGPLIKNAANGENPLIASYRTHRDQRKHDDAVSQAASPDAFGVGQFAGAASMPMAKAGIAGRLAQGTAYGGLYGLGESDADLTKGQTGPALRDMGEGMALGFATSAVAEPVMAAGRYSSALKARGKEAEIAAVSKAKTKDFASERGGLGSDSRGTLTRLETADKILASPLATPEMKAQAQAFLDSDLGKQTRLTAWQNTLDDLPSQMGQMQERRGAMDAAAAAAEPAAVEATAMENLNQSVFQKEIIPRADRLMGNKLLSMIGQFGGAPITTTKNLLKAPRMQYRAGQIGEAVAAPMSVAAKATQSGGTQLLEDYLRPKDDEERQEQGAAWFTSGSRR